MKLRMYLTMLAVSLLSYTMQSCDDDDDDSKNVSEQLEMLSLKHLEMLNTNGLSVALIMSQNSNKTIKKKKLGMM